MDKKQLFGGKTLRYGGYSVVITAIVLVAIILLNLGMNLLPSRYTKPATDGTGMYDISDTSRTLVEGVKDEVTVYLICYKEHLGIEIVMRIKEYIDRYVDMNNKLKAEYIDPAVHPTFVESYADSEETINVSMPNVLVVNESKSRHKVITYEDMFRYEYDYTQEELYYYQMYGVTPEPTASYFALENKLTNAVHYVTLEKLPVLYYTKGHSELSPDTYAKAYAIEQNVGLKELDLATAEKVPDDADALWINCPSKDFTAEEVEKLTAYAESGGTVILSSYYLTSDEGRSLPNLFGFTESYGLGYQDALICEGNSSYHPTGEPYKVFAQLVGDFQKWAYNQTVTMYTPHGITIKETEKVTITELMTTTVNGFAKTTLPEKGSIVKEEGDAEGKFVLGAVAEKKQEGAVSKLYWFSSYSLLNLEYVDSRYRNPYPYLSLLIETCEAEYLVIDDKLLSVEYLTVSEKAATVWSVILIGIVPVGVLVGGFFIWRRRLTR